MQRYLLSFLFALSWLKISTVMFTASEIKGTKEAADLKMQQNDLPGCEPPSDPACPFRGSLSEGDSQLESSRSPVITVVTSPSQENDIEPTIHRTITAHLPTPSLDRSPRLIFRPVRSEPTNSIARSLRTAMRPSSIRTATQTTALTMQMTASNEQMDHAAPEEKALQLQPVRSSAARATRTVRPFVATRVVSTRVPELGKAATSNYEPSEIATQQRRTQVNQDTTAKPVKRGGAPTLETTEPDEEDRATATIVMHKTTSTPTLAGTDEPEVTARMREQVVTTQKPEPAEEDEVTEKISRLRQAATAPFSTEPSASNQDAEDAEVSTLPSQSAKASTTTETTTEETTESTKKTTKRRSVTSAARTTVATTDLAVPPESSDPLKSNQDLQPKPAVSISPTFTQRCADDQLLKLHNKQTLLLTEIQTREDGIVTWIKTSMKHHKKSFLPEADFPEDYLTSTYSYPEFTGHVQSVSVLQEQKSTRIYETLFRPVHMPDGEIFKRKLETRYAECVGLPYN